VLAPALWRDVGDRALQDLQERLLHALAGHVTRDRRVLRLARDLVDLVDVDDTALGALHVVVRGLEQAQNDVLDVLTDVAGLGERGRIRDRERHAQHLRERLREERLARAGRADQQNVRLLELDVSGVTVGFDALVVVVDRDREDLLRALLPDDVLVQHRLDLGGLRQAPDLAALLLFPLLRDDVVAELDALVTDVDGGASDQLANVVLTLAAKRTFQRPVAFTSAGHAVLRSS